MTTETASSRAEGNSPAAVAFAWLLVGLPLLWGIWETVKKSQALFH